MSPDSARKRCVVAYALPSHQHLWPVELPAEATIQDAINEVRRTFNPQDIPWEESDVGIFGEVKTRDAVPRDGDRIELYRPLAHDPKESRRDRVKRLRKR